MKNLIKQIKKIKGPICISLHGINCSFDIEVVKADLIYQLVYAKENQGTDGLCLIKRASDHLLTRI